MKKSKAELIQLLHDTCKELGWAIAYKEKKDLEGMIIGTMSYIQSVGVQLEDVEEYDLVSLATDTDKTNLH